MKTSRYFPVLLSLIAAMNLHGEDLSTLDGKVYKNIKVSSETKDAIKLMHDGGVSIVKKTDVPPAFISLHELSPPAASASAKADDAKKAKLATFAALSPTFDTKDGRHYNSADIKDMDPAGLKIVTASGPVRVKFTELPIPVRTALGYDAAQSVAFEKQQAATKARTDAENQHKANAASVVDLRSGNFRVFLGVNYEDGWNCDIVRLRTQDREVITSRQGSSLSSGTVTYEKAGAGKFGSKVKSTSPAIIQERTVVQDIVADGPMISAIVFGLQDYNHLQSDQQGRRLWSGNLYFGGTITMTDNSVRETYWTDRAKALARVAETMFGKETGKDKAPGQPPAGTGS